MPPRIYSEYTLLELNKRCDKQHCSPIDPLVWTELTTLGIASKTRRGCQGGKNKQRQIGVHITPNKPANESKCHSVEVPRAQNPKNLIQVPLVKSSHNAPGIRFATWNARSIKTKHNSTALCDFVINNQLDPLIVTETWLTSTDKDNRAIADIKNTLPNYQLSTSIVSKKEAVI